MEADPTTTTTDRAASLWKRKKLRAMRPA